MGKHFDRADKLSSGSSQIQHIHNHGRQACCILGRYWRMYGWNPKRKGQEVAKSVRCTMP